MNSRLKFRILLVAGMLVTIAGCEKVVYLPLEATERRIVLNGLLCPDSIVMVSISRTLRIFPDYPFDTIPPPDDSMKVDDASLYEDGRLVGKLQPLRATFFGLPGFRPVSGKSYRIGVSSGDMKPATATMVVPEPVALKSFDTARVVQANGREAIRITLLLPDPVGEENYYAVLVTGTQRYYWDIYTRTIIDSVKTYRFVPKLSGKADGVIELDFLDVNRDVYLDDKLVFSDQLFNGTLFEMSFEVPHNYWTKMADTVLFGVNIQQIDKSYYQYAVSCQKYFHSRGNPFSEPVQVFSNVTNGFGLFSAYNGVRKEFEMVWGR